MPSVGKYPYTHISHSVGQPPNNEPISRENPIDSILMLKLGDLRRQENMKNGSLEQASDVEAQTKVQPTRGEVEGSRGGRHLWSDKRNRAQFVIKFGYPAKVQSP